MAGTRWVVHSTEIENETTDEARREAEQTLSVYTLRGCGEQDPPIADVHVLGHGLTNVNDPEHVEHNDEDIDVQNIPKEASSASQAEK